MPNLDREVELCIFSPLRLLGSIHPLRMHQQPCHNHTALLRFDTHPTPAPASFLLLHSTPYASPNSVTTQRQNSSQRTPHSLSLWALTPEPRLASRTSRAQTSADRNSKAAHRTQFSTSDPRPASLRL